MDPPTVDLHTHLGGRGDEGSGCWMHPRLLVRLPVWYLRRRLGISRKAFLTRMDRSLREQSLRELDAARMVDYAVVLAMDWFHGEEGSADRCRTDTYTPNEYAARLAQEHARVLFGCSVHPYRADALDELEGAIERGAVLLKWLPVHMNIDPGDRRSIRIYRRLAEAGLPLLSPLQNELQAHVRSLSLPKCEPHRKGIERPYFDGAYF